MFVLLDFNLKMHTHESGFFPPSSFEIKAQYRIFSKEMVDEENLLLLSPLGLHNVVIAYLLCNLNVPECTPGLFRVRTPVPNQIYKDLFDLQVTYSPLH